MAPVDDPADDNPDKASKDETRDPARDPLRDPGDVTVRPSKKALREEREARLAKALRDNLARRKGQIRARVKPGPDPEPEMEPDRET